jgi:hypothetical protein
MISCLNSHAELRQQIEIARIERVSLQSENSSLRRDQEILRNAIQQLGIDLRRFIDDTTPTIAELGSQLTELAPLSIVAELEAEVNFMKATYAKKSELDEMSGNLVTVANFEERCRSVSCVAKILSFHRASLLEGIIHYLNGRYGGNVHERGVVHVTASSECARIAPDGHDRSSKNVVDFESHTDYCSQDSPNQWICLQFNLHHVTITHYSIRSFGHATFQAHPKSWVLEGSNDGKNWIELDRRTNDAQLNGQLMVVGYDVTNSALCCFIRLRQIDKNHDGTDFLVLSALELFGLILG